MSKQDKRKQIQSSLQSGKTFRSLATSEKMEVLVAIYEQLDQNHHHHNKIIFQTYYLSVVFFGTIGSIILTADLSPQLTAASAIFGGFVMLLLWFWAYMYIKARRQIKERKLMVMRELEQHNDEFVTMDTVRNAFFFTHTETAERTVLARVLEALGKETEGDFISVEQGKDVAQWTYFLVLSALFFGFALWVLV